MAQLDPSIILGAKPMQIESPVNQLAKVLQVQEMQQMGDQRAMQMQDAQRARESRNRLNQLLQSGATPETLMRGGFMAEAQAMQEAQGKAAKNTADVGKTTAETEKVRLQAGREKLGFVAQILSGVKDQATYEQAKSLAQQNGLPIDNMPAQYDPAVIEQAKTQALTVQDQLEQIWKQKGYDLDVRKQGETERNNKTQNAISQGNLRVAQGNLSLSGQRLAFDKAQPKGVLDSERGLLVDPRTGEARPVTMGGQPVGVGRKPLNEGQGKANLFGTRMEEANNILTDLEGKYSPLAVNAKMAAGDAPMVGGAAGAAGNMMLSVEAQQVEQAQRDFINAVLRRESGAVINPEEFKNGQKQYFPQPGDKPNTLAQKRRNRELAIEGIRAEVPGGFRSSPSGSDRGLPSKSAIEAEIQRRAKAKEAK